MADRKIIKVIPTRAKLKWRVVLECGHSRYYSEEKRVGDVMQCIQKKCKWDFK
jgi:hypothetical protein